MSNENLSEISDETKIKCLVKKCVYNIDNKCRKIEILIRIKDDLPTCSGYDTFNVIRK